MNDKIFKEQEDKYRDDENKRKEEENKVHDSGESEQMFPKEHIANCERCDAYFFLNAPPLLNDEKETFKCGWKVIKLNGQYLCPDCLIKTLWEMGKQVMEV